MGGRGLLTKRIGRLLAALLVTAAAALVAVPGAFAGQGIWITVHNETSANLNLLSREGSNCWEGQQLNHAKGADFVAPGNTRTYASEKKTGRGCGGDAHQNVQFAVQDPGGPWLSLEKSMPRYSLFWQDGNDGGNRGINLYDGLGTWVPRADGKGLLCLHSVIKDENHADIYAYQDRHCNEAVPETIQRHPQGPAPAVSPRPFTLAAPVSAGENGNETEEEKKKKEEERKKEETDYPGVINVLSAVGVACNWYVYPKDPQRCAKIDPGNPQNWSIGNVSTAVRDFKIKKDDVTAAQEKRLVGAAEVLIPPEGSPGQLSVNESVGLSESTSSTTQQGGKIGAKLGFSQTAKVNIFFTEGSVTFSQEINAETNWSLTDAKTRTQSTTRSVQISTGAKPGFKTELEVFTSKRKANYIYEADLDFGSPDGEPQNVTTPANLALGQSPADRQPCLAYVVGEDGVRNSLVNIGKTLQRAGYRADDSSLTEAQRAFLAATDNYRNGKTPCAGFPAGYSSWAGFKGVGVGTYANLGYDLSGNPVTKMVGCVYVRPYQVVGPPTARTRRLAAASRARLAADESATEAASPCQEVSIKGGFVGATPGVLVEDSGLGGAQAKPGFAGPTAEGTAGSDHIVGPSDGGTVRTGGGAFDTVDTGSGDTRVYATAKENLVEAEGGNDLLVAGQGMSYLYGGGGGDHLVEKGGGADMFGEGGADTFEGHDMSGTMFGGGGRDRMVGTGDLSQLAMSGGAGSNVYVVKGKGTPAIVQLPGPGHSRVLTVHSLTVPPNVAVAEAIGGARMTLRGDEAHELIAGKGGATLIAGPEPARLRGGPKSDTIVFNQNNDDVAVGGAGGDRFIFSGSPESGTRPAGLRPPPHPSAPLVKDFTPSQGDRLVMKSSVFGHEVLDLGKRFEVVAAAHPRPRAARPTLLLDTRDGIVSFDRDGSGPISDQVVVELPGARTLRRGWFVFAHH